MLLSLRNPHTRYSFAYSVRRFYWIPILVGLVAVLLFFPPLHRLVPDASQPVWFWTRIFILMMVVYAALVVTYL